MSIPTLPGINAKSVATARITTRVLFTGDESGTPVVFVHGNLTSATFWEETMVTMPASYRSIALDQRGFGEADPSAAVDGSRGLADMSDDVIALMDTLGIDAAHLVGHSMGGGVLWRLMMDAPERLLSASFIAPVSPFGFGGTKDAEGTLCAADGAGSGGGVANPQYTQMLKDGERGDGEMTPRQVMNNFYWKPPYTSEREEDLLTSVLQTHTGERDYPGDSTASENWPAVAPGRWGVLNGMAPNNQPDISRLYAIDPKPTCALAARRQRPGHRRYVDVRPGDVRQAGHRAGLARRRSLPAPAHDRADAAGAGQVCGGWRERAGDRARRLRSQSLHRKGG